MKRRIYFAILCCLCLFSTANAQFTPLPEINYMLVNQTGYSLAYSGGHCVTATRNDADQNQLWTFEDTGTGSYTLKNVGQQAYVFLGASDGWNLAFGTSLPEEVTRGQYQLVAQDTVYFGIRMLYTSGFFGTDGVGNGQWVFGNKSNTANHGLWKMVAKFDDAIAEYNAYHKAVEKEMTNKLQDYPGLQGQISDSLLAVDNVYDNTVLADCQAGVPALKHLLDEIEKLHTLATKLVAQLDNVSTLLQNTSYPGHDALQKQCDDMNALIVSEDFTIAQAEGLSDEISKDVAAYYMSKVPVATPDDPADVTCLVKNPSFRKEADYSADCTITSDGWTAYSVNAAGTNIEAKNKGAAETGKNISCFNCWATSFTHMDVSQQLTGLPNGKYVVKCMAWTSGNCNLNQHAFAESGTGVKAVSADATAAMCDNTTWENFTTASVNVLDGRLRIGFESSKDDPTGNVGWFVVTDFKLLYQGAADADALAAAKADRLATVDTLNVILKGDKKQFDDAVTAVKNAADDATLLTALGQLNDAFNNGLKSNDRYRSFSGGIYSSMKAWTDTMAVADAKTALQKMIATTDAVLVADTTTRAALIPFGASFTAYRNLVSLYTGSVASVLNSATDYRTEAIDKIKTLVAEGWADVAASDTAGTVNALIAKLNIALDDARLSKNASDNTSMTFLIKNPDITQSDGSTITGWEVNLGGADWCSSAGQSFTNKTDRYLDAWSSAGNFRFTASQKIVNLPNGLYRLKAASRAGAGNVYLYSQTADSLYKKALPDWQINQIYKDALKAMQDSAYAAGADSVQVSLMKPNVISQGWSWVVVDSIEVKDHTMTIGISGDSLVTKAPNMSGSWFSVDKFQLIYFKAGDNSDFGYTTPVNTAALTDFQVRSRDGYIEVSGDRPYRIYDLAGKMLPNGVRLAKGLYIVRCGGESRKIVIR